MLKQRSALSLRRSLIQFETHFAGKQLDRITPPTERPSGAGFKPCYFKSSEGDRNAESLAPHREKRYELRLSLEPKTPKSWEYRIRTDSEVDEIDLNP